MKTSLRLAVVSCLILAGCSANPTATVTERVTVTAPAPLTLSPTASQPTVQQSTTQPTIAPTSVSAPETQVFNPPLEVNKNTNLARLPVGKGFKAYLAARIKADPYWMMYIDRYRSDGYAAGSAGSTDPEKYEGYYAYYSKASGTWKEVLGVQDAPECSEVRKAGLPAEFYADTCRENDKLIRYRG